MNSYLPRSAGGKLLNLYGLILPHVHLAKKYKDALRAFHCILILSRTAVVKASESFCPKFFLPKIFSRIGNMEPKVSETRSRFIILFLNLDCGGSLRCELTDLSFCTRSS